MVQLYNLRFLNTPRPDFNTSYVMVQLDSTLEKIFNNSFQYILCYGST